MLFRSNQSVTFTPNNSKINITADGLITGKKAGTAWVIARESGGKKASMRVTVKKAPKKITLSKKMKKMKKGASYQIKVKLPKNTASNKLTFTSNKKSVATVSPTGKVTAKKKGQATITVKTYNGKKAKIKIRVK